MAEIDKYFADPIRGIAMINNLPPGKHPIFSDGLSLITEYQNYIGALKIRIRDQTINELSDYVDRCEKNYEIYKMKFDTNIVYAQVPEKLKNDLLISPNYLDNFGNENSLITAADINDISFFRAICDKHKIIPGIFDKGGKFDDGILDHICITLDKEKLEVVLNYEINVNRKSAFGGTCLHWLYCAITCVTMLNQTSMVLTGYQMIEILTKAGIDIHIKDNFGKEASEYLFFEI